MTKEFSTEMSRPVAWASISPFAGIGMFALFQGALGALFVPAIPVAIATAVVYVAAPASRPKIRGFFGHMKEAVGIVAGDIKHLSLMAIGKADRVLTEKVNDIKAADDRVAPAAGAPGASTPSNVASITPLQQRFKEEADRLLAEASIAAQAVKQEATVAAQTVKRTISGPRSQ